MSASVDNCPELPSPYAMSGGMMQVIRRPLILLADLLMLAGQKQLQVNYANLRAPQSLDLPTLLGPRDEWPSITDTLASLMERRPNSTSAGGALNRGDRRAIYGMIRALKPASVLEIGTHIGSSTIHIAAALRENTAEDRPGKLTTVDVIDVNAEQAPWARSGMKRSPRQMIDDLGMDGQVTFRVGDSIDFLKNCVDPFEFIFLDGSHAAKNVYNEIQLAQRCLSANGLILLHDFSPDGKPLWAELRPLPGPWLAYARLRREGAPIRVIPLGDLPWPTKAGTNVTSLALVTRI